MKILIAMSACALLAGCASTHRVSPRLAGSDASFTQAQTVEVRLSNFMFTPSPVMLEANHPYILKIVDTASGGHDFTAPEFFAAATVAPEDAARVAGGQIELKGGEAATIHIIPAAGEYKLVCTHFGHVALGMTGKIIVH